VINETESQTRLRRAKESVIALQAAEAEARKALADATESTKRAREKYEELFVNEEKAERARRKNNYDHCTL
jgi:hypothetical protein